jgi:DNA-binding CsgD family transcriptional regulator
LNPATVHRVLTRYGLARLAHLDRATGRPVRQTRQVRRYEHAVPGDLVHVDIKKLGNIPDGGGHRTVGRQAGQRHRTRTPGKTLDPGGNSHVGYGYLNNALEGDSRRIPQDGGRGSVRSRRCRARDGPARQRPTQWIPAEKPHYGRRRLRRDARAHRPGSLGRGPGAGPELVAAQRVADPLDILSQREREVLALMAEGRSNGGISRKLWIAEGTVEKHVRSILVRLRLPEADDVRAASSPC